MVNMAKSMSQEDKKKQHRARYHSYLEGKKAGWKESRNTSIEPKMWRK